VGEGTTEIDLEQILENSKAEAEERKAEVQGAIFPSPHSKGSQH
jgi:hypothetical protein